MPFATRVLQICLAVLATGAVASPVAAAAADCGPQALGVSRIVEIDGGQRLALGLQTYPRALALRDREVVLTFDDGPTPGATSRVLDALKEECVRATFFLVGRHAEETPALVRREVEEGHSVGHHSYSHPARTLRLWSDATAKADIERGFAAVDKAGFGAAGPAPKIPFFRFPGFADTPELVRWLQDRGIAVFGADLWASDWQEMTPQAELDLVLSRLEAAGRGVILFHDSRPSTAKMLPDFLKTLKTRGYRVVHMVPGAGPTPVEDAKPGWTSATEAIIAKTLGKSKPREGRSNGN
ncbi:MAG: polysaccharide deacetylase [Methylocystaceae bacterium]|nr:MAG: polysaccharide deacetylase [Methylocystaceae bacterium]